MKELTSFETQTVAGGLAAASPSLSGGGFFSNLWGDIERDVSRIFGGGGGGGGEGGSPLPTSCTPAAQRRYVKGFQMAGATTDALEETDSNSSLGSIIKIFSGGAENVDVAKANIKKVCGKVNLKGG